MADREDYIGVFDSGVGGITVLQQLMEILPEERYLYFGDSAHAPYGTRTREEVQKLSLAAIQKMVDQGLKILVLACNTATATSLDLMHQAWPELEIVGIRPAVEQAALGYPGGTVGIMATPLTLQSEKTKAMFEKYRERCHLIPLPVPGLADLVEQGKADSPECHALLQPILGPLAGKLDALALGCTHYPFASGVIRSIMGDIPMIDGAPITAHAAKKRLEELGLLRRGKGSVSIQSSAPGHGMADLCFRLMGGNPIL